jgi:RHS repeat-associated protein
MTEKLSRNDLKVFQGALRRLQDSFFSTKLHKSAAIAFRKVVLMIVVTCCLSEAWAENASVPAMRFSAQPTEEEIAWARVFDEPLLAIGGKPGAAENKALADSLSAYAARTNFDDLSSFGNFLERFPNSAWTGSLLLHLGTEYYNYGHYSKALDAWEQAWQVLKSSDDPKGKPQADRALGELARMYGKLGRMAELSKLLASVTNRSLTGPGTQLIHAAQEALWLMQHRPGIAFKCGPLALDWILAENDPSKAANPLVNQAESTTNGFSLSQVAELSGQLGMNYQAAFRSPHSSWITPAVIHWKVGHYAALLRQDGDRFLVRDRTFQSSLWMTASALEEESSGYFLVPPGALPAGWRAVSEAEAQGIWGKGIDHGKDTTCTRCEDQTSGGSSGSGSSSNPSGGSSCSKCSGGSQNPTGMTTYTFHTMLVSLTLNDTPVGYNPPVGPSVQFGATYNQYEANQPATFSYANLGPKWTCNWIGYITDYPNSPGQNVSCYQPGGGTLTFVGFNPANGTFAPETMTQGILTQTSPSTYQIQFRSGASWIFGLTNGSAGSSRQVFLTQILDPAGNSVTLNYDSSFRITNITDAIGQATVLGYTNSAYPDAITSVQDPFGRTAYFQYNGSGLLSQITDVIGITSQYAYGPNDFVTALTTPYGTTTFAGDFTNGLASLQATDPLGETELAESPMPTSSFSSLAPTSDPPSTLPTNLPVAPFNQYLEYGVTFFWDKQAYLQAADDPRAATAYNFLYNDGAAIEGGVLMSVKRPLENRVWFNYPGQISSYAIGLAGINAPSAVGRVLDDGSSQTSFSQYNALGNLTNSIDPIGRSFTYVYATNNIDLLQVIMTSNGRNEVQSTMTYNSQHEPLTVTDAAGQTTTNTYNARGQILSITDPLGELTSYAYDTNGYLLSITGPLQATNDITSFTYDAFGLVHTKTDTEGYTLTYAYDAMDRVTNVTHPDGTSEQFVYTLLDLTASADRLGRWSTNTYNADRQLVQAQDPLGRITQYDYCDCGDLDAVLDPAGNATWWDHDGQSRITAKHYADGSTVAYTYENTTSRLHSRLDEKRQQTLYHYYDDNNLQSIIYSNAIIPTPTILYTYDTNYNRIVTMQDGIGTTAYFYIPITSPPIFGAGKLASVSGPLPNSTIGYQYDSLGRVIGRVIDDVTEATIFDVLGRSTTITNALGAFQYSYVGATTRVASESYPNGQTNLYSYYNNIGDERLLQIQHLYPDGSLLSAFGYAYNAVGDVISWTNQWDTLPTRNWFPSYDAADQLTNVAVQGSGWTLTNYSYAYDSDGNRLLAGTNGIQTQFSYNSLNQIVGSSAPLTNTSYEWDAEYRLTAVNQGRNRSELYYDGLGQRTRIVELTNGVVQSTIYFLWSANNICEQRDATGAIIVKRFYTKGVELVNGSNAGYYFYTKDHLQSNRELTDSASIIRARYDYDPFGILTESSGDLENDFRFTGFYYHVPSGLSLASFRPYDPQLGRWLSRDPFGELGAETKALRKTPEYYILRATSAIDLAAPNLYEYVGNDAVDHNDPYGLVSIPDYLIPSPVTACQFFCGVWGAACLVGCTGVTDGLGVVMCRIGCAALTGYCNAQCKHLPDCWSTDHGKPTIYPQNPFPKRPQLP